MYYRDHNIYRIKTYKKDSTKDGREGLRIYHYKVLTLNMN